MSSDSDNVAPSGIEARAPQEEIRLARQNGELLGDLVARYGADAVVQALGVQGVAHILGLDEPIDRTYDDDDYF